MELVGEAPEPIVTAQELLNELVKRATDAGIASEFIAYEEEDYDESDPGFVRLQFPNGRKSRLLTFARLRARRLLATDFESLIFLGEHQAFINTLSGTIEAQITPSSSMPGVRSRLWTLPGVEILDEVVEAEDDAIDELESSVGPPSRPEKWRLQIAAGSKTIEVSPASALAEAVWPRGSTLATIKLSGYSTSSHDDALSVLESVVNGFLFELDVLYGTPFTLAHRRMPIRRGIQERAAHPPAFPRNQYATEALALYQYARSSNGLPLLEYLAYYQSLEFFFPVFAREATVKALRTALLNPKFNPIDDSAVNRLINLAAPAIRAGIGEREQLRATVRACLDVGELVELIESSELFKEHFCAKKQSVRGVSPIRLQGDHSDLRDQVADRIYAIRCRVVHTKQDGSGPGEDILLPSSAEAQSLQPDIALVRLVAQRTLSARAARALLE